MRLPPGLSFNATLGLFITMQFFLICSPALFLAFNYMVYGRFIRQRVGAKYCLIRPERITKFFILSDITTFGIQVRTLPSLSYL